MNVCLLIGRAVADIELKSTQSNISFCNFTIAVDRQFKNDDGESQADFINIVCWRKTAELVSKYVKKGHKVAVSGRIQTRNYETENGTKYITEVVCDTVQFLETKTEGNYPTTDEQIDETYKDNPYNPTITTPTERREERKQSPYDFIEGGKASEEDLPF